MKKPILTVWLLAVMLLAGYSFAPKVDAEKGSKKNCTGHITLASQAEVDAFACKDVNGLLTISGEDITNLDALSSLKHVRGLHITGNP
ncbi:MAG TPA: hypothetical protein VFO54_05180, partial [Chryseosolibacter sp.]|nr:hypothetical protein [Chryseosolibacter sp.]